MKNQHTASRGFIYRTLAKSKRSDLLASSEEKSFYEGPRRAGAELRRPISLYDVKPNIDHASDTTRFASPVRVRYVR